MMSPFSNRYLMIRSFVLVLAFGALGSIGIARYVGQQPTAGTNSALEFDACLQDETTGNTILFNSHTGDFIFCPVSGASVKGRATLNSHSGTTTTLDYSKGDVNV